MNNKYVSVPRGEVEALVTSIKKDANRYLSGERSYDEYLRLHKHADALNEILSRDTPSTPRVVTGLDDLLRRVRHRLMVYQGEKEHPNTQALIDEIGQALESFAHSLPAQTVKEGWVLVPVEPTAEMLSCIAFSKWPDDSKAGKELQRKRGRDVVFPKCEIEMAVGQYQRMLAAAPRPEESDE